MTKDEAMQMALDALVDLSDERYWFELHEKALVALRTALTQPEPNARKLAKIHQAAWNAVHKDYKDDPECCFALGFDAGYGAVAQKVEPPEMESGERFESFPASPNKEWVELTDYEVEELNCVERRYIGTGEYVIEGEYDFARLIEAKLKEKNI